MRRLLLAALLAASCWSSVFAATHNVQVGNNFFSPRNLTIQLGDTVTWVRVAGDHDVVANNGSFRSPFPMRNPFSHTFNTAGTFNYFCTPHVSQGMTGTITVQGAPNQNPTVAITAPANNSTFVTTDQITINANASDTDGTVSSVQFFSGTTPLGTDTIEPYSVTVTLSAGSHTLTARATDNRSGVTTSPPINITVNPANQLPTVQITSPANGANFTTADTINIEASADDANGKVNQVQFFDGNTPLGTDSVAPYSISLQLGAGNHSLTAQATDNQGGVGTSAAVNINVAVIVNQPPTATITSPAANIVVAEGTQLTFSAIASDPEGQLARVEFMNGAAQLGTDNSAPFTTSATLPLGQHQITADAYDQGGSKGSSAAVTVTVIRRSNITGLTIIAGPQVQITATGATGFPHTLQGSLDLKIWNDITTQNPNRSGGLTYTDGAPSNPHRFYRIIVK